MLGCTLQERQLLFGILLPFSCLTQSSAGFEEHQHHCRGKLFQFAGEIRVLLTYEANKAMVLCQCLFLCYFALFLISAAFADPAGIALLVL